MISNKFEINKQSLQLMLKIMKTRLHQPIIHLWIFNDTGN
ncbi:MAG: hypothetical protein RIT10_54 [Bacteroidota bacterium]|jgi:hypothetical protein